MPRLAALALLLALAPAAGGQGFTPAEAVKRMKLPDGFSARVVAHEPTIRQPLSISFDSRGRLWVLQYLQYPNYAGLKPLKQDQYLRTVWDKQPEPPPRGPKGADRLTILSDPDDHGVFRKSKDFVTGLNIASGFCLAPGGVYVAQPPYLLYYPDKNDDDVPDGDPEVLLTGFGMDDTHSLANSLQFGPDGWLYGAAGSTTTSRIKNPADPKAPPVEFQQGLWRYHPKTKRFELFSEGGGNTYGLDFDKHGQAIAGTNWGGFACLHQFPGAYYVKGFAKHGPLHNPHAYGYFDHVPYTGFKGGHVTCGGVVYQADAYPASFRDKYIAGNLLSNAVYWHNLDPVGASFKGGHGGELLEANDTWFRPVDLTVGPDGCIYVADWYDRRAAHLDPLDNWDRTNGRVFRIEYKGGPKYPTFDLRTKSPAELVELLKHPNVWWRRQARELLAVKADDATRATLRKQTETGKGTDALEALWALHAAGGLDYDGCVAYLGHPDEHVRAWAVRLLGDGGGNGPAGRLALPKLVTVERSPVVLAQWACTARRLEPMTAGFIVSRLAGNPACERDPHLPLLTWWALDAATTAKGRAGYLPAGDEDKPGNTFDQFLAERLARRLASSDFEDRFQQLGHMLWGAGGPDVAAVLRGMAVGLAGQTFKEVPDEHLKDQLAGLWAKDAGNPLLVEVLARMGDPAALAAVRAGTAAPRPAADRLRAMDLLRQLGDPGIEARYLEMFRANAGDALRVGLLDGLATFADPDLGRRVLADYATYSAAVKQRAVRFLVARPAWALALLKAVDAGTFPKADLSADHARAAVGLGDQAVTALVEKHFGRFTPATPGEKQARIAWLGNVLGREPGDPVKGKPLFAKHCAACHKLHGEGGAVGPDLTTADRKNRGSLLAHVVDPSGMIRPEYVVQAITTTDGRTLSGLVTDAAGPTLTVVNVVDDKPVKTVVAKADVESARPSAVSLMPEKLLDTLSEPEVADLFAFLAADPPGGAGLRPAPERAGGPRPQDKKLTVCLVSGSFEYKSDESLAAFRKYLEANYPVRCTLAVAKTEAETTGLDNLADADVAVFFTRRLRIPEAELAKVKKYVASGKPVVGIRTASHGFQDWLEMDRLVFGGNYKGHYGEKNGYALAVAGGAKNHPVLAGVGAFRAAGSLYKNPDVGEGVTVLLRGSIPDHTEPVAWVREADGRRSVYTSLGHPDDFRDPNFTRLLVNALAWATKTELKAAK
ncbi:MAG: ThuA domain-containing protein [Gemmataceae bacterium]|nr:ThuA domain-containing protein [Gemmataceae bacterium]